MKLDVSGPKPFDPIDVGDLKAADALLSNRQLAWAHGLTAEERDALNDYKGNAGRLMNQALRISMKRALRGDVSGEAAMESVMPLRAAMARAEAPADMILHHAVGPTEAALYRRCSSGDVVLAPAFLSTSMSAGVAAAIAHHEVGTVVEILVRRGRKGVAYVHPFPRYRYPQYEVRLNAGTKLRVLQADPKMIRLEVCSDDS